MSTHKKQKIHGLISKGLETGLSSKGHWGRENLDFSEFLISAMSFVLKKGQITPLVVVIAGSVLHCGLLVERYLRSW